MAVEILAKASVAQPFCRDLHALGKNASIYRDSGPRGKRLGLGPGGRSEGGGRRRVRERGGGHRNHMVE